MGFWSDLFGGSNPDDSAVIINGDGVYFVECEEPIGWKDVKEVEEINDGSGFQFRLRGGLLFDTEEIYFTEEFKELIDNGDIELPDMAQCKAKATYELDYYDLKDANNRKLILSALSDLLWAKDLANKIRESDRLTIWEGDLFCRYCEGFTALVNINCALQQGGKFKTFNNILPYMDEFIAMLKNQVSYIDPDEPSLHEDIASIFVWTNLLSFPDSELPSSGVDEQAAFYDNLRNARAYGWKFTGDETPANVLIGKSGFRKSGEFNAFGDDAWAKRRKVIVCTGEKAAPGTWRDGLQLPNTMVIDAQDLVEYNESVDGDLKLVFEPGHPQNGCTYVQHPFRKNLYFEANSFHDSIRERKQNELLRILESLGAYSAQVHVRHEWQESEDCEDDADVAMEGSYGLVKGSMSQKTKRGRQSTSSTTQSATKDWTFNPPENPCLPDDLVFYPTEETWQQLAKSVLRGGLKRAVVDLEYKSEYGITEKYLTDIAVSAKSVIPSFDMNLNSNFSSNLHRLTTTQWHYDVVFENESGERAGGKSAGKDAEKQVVQSLPSQPNDKAEALFAKRARRYAQSEGHINAEQRADLEAFAQKYGIDEFRMEELIEEAFES